MSAARKSVVIPFTVAGLLALAALSAWIFAIESHSSAPAACNNTYSIFAEMPPCRRPAIFVALGWIAFTLAIALGWVGGVRKRRNRTSGDAGSGNDRGAPPHDARPSI